MAQTRTYQTPVSGGAKYAYNLEQSKKAQAAQQAQANAIAQAQANIAAQQAQAYKNNQLDSGAKLINDVGSNALSAINGATNGNGGGGTGTVYSQASAPADPYASIYSLYEQQMNAQRDALNQQRQARLNALQANYNNAKSKLDSSFASGETELNQNADEALRQAYITNKLNQRDMAQYLAGQGVTGGAAESILANLYNSYGNNRNDIEKGRANDLRSLLANYQGTLGDIENSYLAGMADADSDYSGSIADALTNYYGNLASLQAQNIANQYKAALSKSGSSKKAETESPYNADILKGLKNYKDSYANARQYLARSGVPESMMEDYLWEAGLGGLLSSDEAVQQVANTVPNSVRTNVLNTLRQVASLSRGTDDLEKNIAAQMDQLVKTYGLNQAQATALLKELGF